MLSKPFKSLSLINENIMHTLKSLSVSLFLVALTLISSSAYAMKGPEQVVRETVDSIVNNIQTNRAVYQNDTKALYAMVENTLVPALHVPRMANLILGKEASRSASSAQKAAFANEFKTFLMRSYATALLEYTGSEKVVYEPIKMAPGADKVTVKAALIAASGKQYPVNLYMSNRKDDRWRAYNLEVAGINFISTYRATFSEIIAQKGIDGLIEDLRTKNAR